MSIKEYSFEYHLLPQWDWFWRSLEATLSNEMVTRTKGHFSVTPRM